MKHVDHEKLFLPEMLASLPIAGLDGTLKKKYNHTAVENRLRGKTVRTILVVDDNEPAAKGLAELLRRESHTVHVAYTGEEALAQVGRHRPDTVILDIGLPDMTGYEVAEQMRAIEGLALRIIALTGYGQEDDKTKTRVAGFDAHLVKPVTLVDVESVL